MTKDELMEIVCQAHMAGQNNQADCDPSWSEAHAYWTHEVEPEIKDENIEIEEGKE